MPSTPRRRAVTTTPPSAAERQSGAGQHMAGVRATAALLQNAGIAPLKLRYADKKPAMEEWKNYQVVPPSEQEIARWFDNGMCNIGALCGWISGGLAVLVFNHQDAYSAFFAGEDICRQTWVVESKRGPHVYVRTRGE